MDIIKFARHGEEKLWVVFWGYGSLLLLLIKTMNTIIEYDLRIISSIINISLFIFYLIVLWRCAFNTKIKFFGYLTRGLIIIFIIASIDFFIEKYNGVPKGPIFIDYRQQQPVTTNIKQQPTDINGKYP